MKRFKAASLPKPTVQDRERDATQWAKWLIPSAAVLFGVIGYIIESAHSSFLGGGISSSPGASYTAAASDFFYQLPTIVGDLLLSCLNTDVNGRKDAPLGGHGTVILAAFILTSMAWWLPRILRIPERTGLIATGILTALLFCKFLWLDAPLASIENIVISREDTPTGLIRSPTGRSHQTPPVEKLIQSRADILRKNIACTRLRSSQTDTVNCQTPDIDYSTMMNGEFAARLLACAFVLALAVKVATSNPRVLQQGLLVVALASLLTLPHAYGKLLKSTDFEVGHIDFSETSRHLALYENSPEDIKQTASPKGEPTTSVDAIVLARRTGTVDLLVLLRGGCSGLEEYAVAKVWSVSSSQILSIREVRKQDVLEWKLRYSRECQRSAKTPN